MESIGPLSTGKLSDSFTDIQLKYSYRPTIMDSTMVHRPKTCTCQYEITIA